MKNGWKTTKSGLDKVMIPERKVGSETSTGIKGQNPVGGNLTVSMKLRSTRSFDCDVWRGNFLALGCR